MMWMRMARRGQRKPWTSQVGMVTVGRGGFAEKLLAKLGARGCRRMYIAYAPGLNGRVYGCLREVALQARRSLGKYLRTSRTCSLCSINPQSG